MFEIVERVLFPEVGANGPLHVGDHCLQRFLADLGEVALLVDHAAALATHAERAGFAGVLGAHGFPELPQAASFAPFAQRVPDCRPTAAGGHFFHIKSSRVK